MTESTLYYSSVHSFVSFILFPLVFPSSVGHSVHTADLGSGFSAVSSILSRQTPKPWVRPQTGVEVGVWSGPAARLLWPAGVSVISQSRWHESGAPPQISPPGPWWSAAASKEEEEEWEERRGQRRVPRLHDGPAHAAHAGPLKRFPQQGLAVSGLTTLHTHKPEQRHKHTLSLKHQGLYFLRELSLC